MIELGPPVRNSSKKRAPLAFNIFTTAAFFSPWGRGRLHNDRRADDKDQFLRKGHVVVVPNILMGESLESL